MPLLDWLNKETDVATGSTAPCRILVPSEPDSQGTVDGRRTNYLIHGDALDAMVALLPYFAGRVKCVYIDPPYNGRSAEIEDYDDNVQHAQWLGSLYPRLELLKKLLHEEGVIFVSIDDAEGHYLKVVMDEVFGRRNFCGTLIWEKKKKPSFLHANFGGVTEYIFAYAKDRTKAPSFVYGKTTEGKKYPINNAGNPPAILSFPARRVRFRCADCDFLPRDMSSGNIVTELLDKLSVRDGVNVDAFRLRGEWRYSQSTLDEIIAAGDEISISKAPFRPNHVKRGGDPKKMKNLLSVSHYGVSTYEDATAESEALFGAASFDYPKPEKLIQILVEAVTEPHDLVLDCYLGSGTTAAVAHKLERSYIGIEHGPQIRTHALKRLSAVIAGERGGITADTGWVGGGGFTFYELGPPLLNDFGLVDSAVSREDLAAYVWLCATGLPFENLDRLPFLGSAKGTAYYLLGGHPADSVAGTLTRSVLDTFRSATPERVVVFADAVTLSTSELQSLGTEFRQLPYALVRR
jgi:adenine-specific DNA-methyltransferase